MKIYGLMEFFDKYFTGKAVKENENQPKSSESTQKLGKLPPKREKKVVNVSRSRRKRLERKKR